MITLSLLSCDVDALTLLRLYFSITLKSAFSENSIMRSMSTRKRGHGILGICKSNRAAEQEQESNGTKNTTVTYAIYRKIFNSPD